MSGRDEAPEPSDGRVSRRDLLRRGGWTSAALLGGGWLGRRLGDDPAAAAAGQGGAEGHAERPTIGAGGGPTENLAEHTNVYGHAAAPPTAMRADALAAVTHPPPFDGRSGVTREHEITVTERTLEVADGVTAEAWTYDGTVPGPILRATAGDRLHIRLRNRTAHPHNLHLHGRHSPQMDGWEPIPPGGEFTYEVEAAPPGVHPYHCHTAPLAEHVARGLHGTLIVDPPGGRADAHEVVLALCGWDLDGDGRNELVTFNGVAGWFHAHPIRVPVGELVRCYVVNMLEHEPVGSFHLHAQTFDVHRTGAGDEPDEHTDTITLGQGERAILEFRLPEPGRYMFHPHQHRLADLGAMGWFAAV